MAACRAANRSLLGQIKLCRYRSTSAEWSRAQRDKDPTTTPWAARPSSSESETTTPLTLRRLAETSTPSSNRTGVPSAISTDSSMFGANLLSLRPRSSERIQFSSRGLGQSIDWKTSHACLRLAVSQVGSIRFSRSRSKAGCPKVSVESSLSVMAEVVIAISLPILPFEAGSIGSFRPRIPWGAL